ncbi:MAG TPA: HU family DNA-binding protein [Rhodothermales bacterium]|nr:HU family DNA-binding protein [Rhodothermales bacterium]
MRKSDIVDQVASATGLTKLETEAVIDGFLLTVTNALKHGESVELRGFGAFKIRRRAPRLARNPKSGERVRVPEQNVPVFVIARGLRREIDDAMRTRDLIGADTDLS